MKIDQIKKDIKDIIKKKRTDIVSDILELEDEADLMSFGILSSLGFIELISELEENYKIQFDFDNIDPSAYSSIAGIAAIIENLTGQK